MPALIQRELVNPSTARLGQPDRANFHCRPGANPEGLRPVFVTNEQTLMKVMLSLQSR